MNTPAAGDVVWPKYLGPYSMELCFQASAAGHAFKSLEKRITERKEISEKIQRIHREGGPPPLEMERKEYVELYLAMVNLIGPILGDVQSFLAAVGVIASILWPSPGRFHHEPESEVRERVDRGAEIRKLLGVSDASVLNSRTGGTDDVRGGLLHFDEMIDEFKRVRQSDDFVSFDIGSAKLGTAIKRDKAVRWLDEDTLDLWVNGRKGNLRELRDELQRTVGRIRLSAKGSLVSSERRGGEPFPFGIALGIDTK